MRCFKYILFIILFVATLNVRAQSNSDSSSCKFTISGKIVDPFTELPLSNVVAYIRETDQRTLSNQTGFFEIANVCVARYQLILSADSYVYDTFEFTIKGNY